MGYQPHEEMRIPYRKESKFNSKLLGFIILILVISVAAFISSSPTAKNEESGAISGFLADLPEKSLHLDSVFSSYGTLDFNTSKADTVVLKTSKPANFRLGGEEIDASDLSGAEITLANFRGKLKVKDKKVFIDGFTDSLYLNTIGISKRTSAIELNYDFDSLHISNIRLSGQDFDELFGQAVVSEKTRLELSDAKVSFQAFKGNIFVDENLSVSGLVDRVSAKNGGQKTEIYQ